MAHHDDVYVVYSPNAKGHNKPKDDGSIGHPPVLIAAFLREDAGGNARHFSHGIERVHG